MTAQQVAFWALAVVSVAAGVAVFTVDSMARATLALLVSLVCVGLILLLTGLTYLGVLVILMMVMEMMVMAVFMVMYMMNPGGLMPMRMVHNNGGAMAVAAGVFVLLAGGAFLVPWPVRRVGLPADPTRALGVAVMGPKMLVMMVVGVAILATMVATVVLAVHRDRGDRPGDTEAEP
ncbi:NADH-quinone oxidoreductase subunit J [Streptosporangium sandarakinum]|uniref:NADH-quinone oxidoreductase subunit J n=1 Tax=Streptosporangium sandarakinum TaxID=1260955 RepID=UPI0033A0A50D